MRRKDMRAFCRPISDDVQSLLRISVTVRTWLRRGELAGRTQCGE